MSAVYWLHRPQHRHIDTQGYVGVSNRIEVRIAAHFLSLASGSHKNPRLQAAFGRGEIISTIVHFGPMADCLAIEVALRPQYEIGWNLLPGGGLPPSRAGMHWFTDGRVNVSAALCPEGFWPGKTQVDGPSHGLSGKPKSVAHRAKIAAQMRAEPRERFVRMGAANKDKPKPKYPCPSGCGAVMSAQALGRWHICGGI